MPDHETPTSPPGYFTTTMVASTAGVTVRTVQAWCNTGLLGHFTSHGGHRYIDGDSMAAVRAASAVAGDIESPIGPGAVIGALLRLRVFDPTFDSDVLAFVRGFLCARYGTDCIAEWK